MRHPLIALTALSALALLGACQALTPEQQALRAVAGTDQDPRRGEEVKEICFTSSINGFGDTTRNTVVVNKNADDHYLIEVYPGCLDLEYTSGLALDSFSGCLTRGDKIYSASVLSGANGQGARLGCSIKAIYRWNPDATLPAAGAGEGERADTPAQ